MFEHVVDPQFGICKHSESIAVNSQHVVKITQYSGKKIPLATYYTWTSAEGDHKYSCNGKEKRLHVIQPGEELSPVGGHIIIQLYFRA